MMSFQNFNRELYAVALENDASCVEALYNLGLCNKKLGMYDDALEVFFKLHNILRNHSQVRKKMFSYQIENESSFHNTPMFVT